MPLPEAMGQQAAPTLEPLVASQRRDYGWCSVPILSSASSSSMDASMPPAPVTGAKRDKESPSRGQDYDSRAAPSGHTAPQSVKATRALTGAMIAAAPPPMGPEVLLPTTDSFLMTHIDEPDL